MKKPKTHLSRMCGVGLLLGCCSPVSLLAIEPNYLNVHSTGGTVDHSIPLDDIHKLTFDDVQVTLWSDEGTQTLLYSNLWKITFGEKTSAIDELPAGDTLQIAYLPAERSLFLSCPSPIGHVALYNLQGQPVLRLSPGVESLSIPLDHLPAGIYVVRAGSGERVKTQKIIKP